MKSICIIMSKPPFGTVHAAEALRLANGAVSYGHDVTILLVDDGVFAAKKGQRAEDTGWTSFAPLLERLTSTGRVRVLADTSSVEERGLTEKDLAVGVQLVENRVISSITASSQMITVF